MKKIFGKGAILILLLMFLAACGSSNETEDTDKDAGESGNAEESKVLKMATSADFPPFESRNPEGEFEGFDIDLAHLIADELGYELEIEDMKFDGLIGALQAGRVDMVMSGMSATEDRKKNVDFSVDYNQSTEMFLSKTDAPVEKMEDLEGKTVAVQLGSIQEEGADKLKDEYGFEVKKIDDAALMIQELLSNRVDAVYMDKEVAIGHKEAQDLFGIDDPTRSSPGMGIAFPKGSELVDDINDVIESLEESGKIEELKDKWFAE